MVADAPLLERATRKAQEISVALFLSGRDHDLPGIRSRVDHLLRYPENMDGAEPAGYRSHSHRLLDQIERDASELMPELVSLVRELRDLVPSGEDL